MENLARAVEQLQQPPVLTVIQCATALVAVILVVVSVCSLRKAARSAQAAERSADAFRKALSVMRDDAAYKRLRDLRDAFDEKGFFQRIRHLYERTGGTRNEEPPFHSFATDKAGTSRKEDKELWEDALGRNPANDRYDLHAVYSFALRLNACLGDGTRKVGSEEQTRRVNDLFGPALLQTLVYHRGSRAA
jgi:hypothetical protein